MSTKKIQILNGASIIPKPDQTYSADSENAQSGKAVAEAISKIGSGKGIDSIEKTSTSGLIDIYTITYTDDTTSTFELTNGKEITSVEVKDLSSVNEYDQVTIFKGLVIYYNDGTRSEIQLPEIFNKNIFISEIENGISIDYVDGELMGSYTITNGKDGRGIANIEKTSTDGLVDTYTITYTDGTTSTFQITNGGSTTVEQLYSYSEEVWS